MMRSLYSGVSGLQNHQTRMDVIGNNISNVNTIGFKRGRVNFQDMISQQIGGSARPTEEKGGVNPKEIGLGMSVAAIDTVFTQGSLQSTGITTDIAINGNGFFVLKDADQTFYTRAGAFGVDSEGTLVNPANGLRVQGWMAENLNGVSMVNTSATPTDITIPIGQKDPPKATENVHYFCNLDKNTPLIPANPTADQLEAGTWHTSVEIYDSFGNKHIMAMDYQRVPETTNQWTVTVNVDPGSDYETDTRIGLGATDGMRNTYTLTFDNMGLLASVTDSAGNVTNPEGEIVLQTSFTVPESNNNADGTPYRQTFNINLGTIGSAENGTTQAASKSSNKANYQDGYGLGYLDTFKIDGTGLITGVYSNGSTRTIGQIAMASFTNQGGLEKHGDTTFMESTNSGMANIGESGTAGKGSLISGTLEMSNVDLTDQLTDMIVTQRGFESNAKTIQTSDSMLETILSLKR
ncbi:MAG TPA: flagellar hook protein FlgE [Treponema sp.]|nr:flagellar hook protein FlgE [Treponema sp.]